MECQQITPICYYQAQLLPNGVENLKPAKRFQLDKAITKHKCEQDVTNTNEIWNEFNCEAHNGAWLGDYDFVELEPHNSNGTSKRRQQFLCQCPLEPLGLTGKWSVDYSIPSMEELQKKFSKTSVEAGGFWEGPENCKPRYRVAIFIPNRGRESHVRTLVNNLHPFLQRQQAQYKIYVLTQGYPRDRKIDRFNRGKLFNAGFAQVQKMCKQNPQGTDCWDCYIFQDADLVPENDKNFYRCGPEPIRLFSAADEFANYDYHVTAQTADQFKRANGFSNLYWGWGAEDMNLRKRFRLIGQPVRFVKGPLGYYKSLELKNKPDDKTNPEIAQDCRQILDELIPKNYKDDGLSNLDYELMEMADEAVFTNITLDLLMESSVKSHPCGKIL